MKQKCKILLVESGSAGKAIILTELTKSNLEFVSLSVDTKEKFLGALNSYDPDVVISTQYLPEFDAFSAMRILRERGNDIPFLLASALSDEEAIDYLKWGAFDYVLKDNMIRLPFAVRNAMVKRILTVEKKSMESVEYHLRQRFQTMSGLN